MRMRWTLSFSCFGEPNQTNGSPRSHYLQMQYHQLRSSQGGNVHTLSYDVHSQAQFTIANVKNNDGLSQKLQFSCHPTRQNHLHLLIRNYIKTPVFKWKLPARGWSSRWNTGEMLKSRSCRVWNKQGGAAHSAWSGEDGEQSFPGQGTAQAEKGICFSFFLSY